MDKQRKIFVAGHRGMVGSALIRRLRDLGYENLIVRDRHELNLLDQEGVASFFREERPDWVFLAAAKVCGIHANNTFRGQFLYENLQIQNNVIHSAYISGSSKLLFLGSSC
ncbi:MAG: NAD-dependent epimerase/dehydratase family protein, partial [Calditrichota bacterium]